MVLNAENVRREYGETVALDGVSLSVDQGSVFALIGPNGAGKTTLIRSLTGTTEYEGEIELLGAPPEQTDTQQIGLLPQSFAPPGRLTARELIEYYGGLYESAHPPTAVLEDVGLTGAADTRYESLSGGQQRRVCVGIALVNDPELLVLDEPTTGIDPAGRRDLWRLLDRLTTAGTTVVLTTHYMDEAEYLADNVGLLADGSLVATGPPQTLIQEYGGQSRLEVELAKSVDPTEAERATESIGTSVETTDRTLTIRGVTPRSIGNVLDVLDDAEIDYGALSWQEPDLESVYLELTETETETEATSSIETPASNDDRMDGMTAP